MTDLRPVAPVSVVIPCYRCSSTVERAVASIERQTTKPIEVILVDDASGDGTLQLLYEIAERHPGWIKVVALTTNKGAASARNAGWETSTQPYIAFLDADDSWHPNKLNIQYDFMCKNPDVFLSGHQCIWLHEGQSMPNLTQEFDLTNINATGLLFKNAFSTPTVMLIRDISFRYSEGKRYAEDLLLWQQIAFSGLKVTRIESPLAYIHKPLYGANGLSGELWKMEKGELDNFAVLYKSGNISFLVYFACILLSITKFIKRFLFIKIKNTFLKHD